MICCICLEPYATYTCKQPGCTTRAHYQCLSQCLHPPTIFTPLCIACPQTFGPLCQLKQTSNTQSHTPPKEGKRVELLFQNVFVHVVCAMFINKQDIMQGVDGVKLKIDRDKDIFNCNADSVNGDVELKIDAGMLTSQCCVCESGCGIKLKCNAMGCKRYVPTTHPLSHHSLIPSLSSSHITQPFASIPCRYLLFLILFTYHPLALFL